MYSDGAEKNSGYAWEGDYIPVFYGIGDVKELLKRRSEFIITRHYYDNPQDPFHRHHAFLGFDDMVEMIFTESEESFRGCSAG